MPIILVSTPKSIISPVLEIPSPKIISKVVASAAANAENNNNMDREKLYVAEIYANQGPTLKRFMPRAQGRATGIRKRTSHIGGTVQER